MARQGLKYGSLLLCLIVSVSAQCFLPNGTDRNAGLFDADYLPFQQNTNDGHSMCCNIHHDTPRSDGLCADLSLGIVWRESCTDPTWESPNCIKLCAAFEKTNFYKHPGTQMEDNDEMVTPCEDGSYCCGNGDQGTSCCRNKGGVFLVDGTTQANKPTKAVAPATLLTSSSESTTYSFSTTLAVDAFPFAPSSSTPSATASASTPAAGSSGQEVQRESSDDSSPNTGAIVGGVVGAIAALLLIAAALWFFVFRKRRRANQPLGSGHGTPSLGYTASEKRMPPLYEAHGLHSNGPELHGGPIDETTGRTELTDGYSGSELGAGSGDRRSRKVEMPG